MSPEQIAGKKVDGRSDLYSLGVMLYQMLTGVLPFRGDSMAELMYKIANEEAPDPRKVRKELPEALAQVVARSLAKKPELRYQDGEEFARDLRAAMAALGGAAAPQPSAAAPVAAPAATAHQPTIAFQAPAAGSDADSTLVMAAGNALAPAAALPGYDAVEKDGAAPGAPFEKTAVMNTSGAPQRPQAGGGKTGQEP
jgi:serine/threonine-protein kinase